MSQLVKDIQAGRAPPAGKLSYDEFLAWCDEDTWAEWVEGDVVMVSPASDRHQDLSGFLSILLRVFAEVHNLGVIRTAPFQMKTGPDLPGREPDILFLAQQHLSRLENTYLNGPADLVVEIVSPESRLRDRGEKFAEYELGGVREYWLLDPEFRRADFYVLSSDGRYHRAPPDAQGVYRSQTMSGFWLQVQWLWQEPLPPTLDALKALRLI